MDARHPRGYAERTLGYYDYEPTVVLERPLALIGFMGAGVSAIGGAIASLTGLPLVDLERVMEHDAGMSLSQLHTTQGEGARRELEGRVLRRVIGQSPFGIVVLGDGTLLARENHALVRAQARLVCIERPRQVLLGMILQRLADRPGTLPEFVFAPPSTTGDLVSLLEARRPAYASADVCFLAGTRTPSRIAAELVGLLGLEGDTGTGGALGRDG